MVKVLFVCLGNICRSPMAEFIFKDLAKKEGLEKFVIARSAGTTYETTGQDMHEEAKLKLNEKGIPYGRHRARRMQKRDYSNFNYIIGMDEQNIQNIYNICGEDTQSKVHKLLDYTDCPKDIDDPWYTGNFEKAYEDIFEGCKALLKFIKEKHNLNFDKDYTKEELVSLIYEDMKKYAAITPSDGKIIEYFALGSKIIDIRVWISDMYSIELDDEDAIPTLKNYYKDLEEYIRRFEN